MEKSHKIYNLIFDFLLAAGVCFYNDLRFMRFWFLGGQLYHSVGFTHYRFGLTGKEVCWVCVSGIKASSAVVCAAVLFQRRVYCSR